MKYRISSIAFALIALFAVQININAQLEIPQPSLGATVTQTVGLTDITIEYSSPGMKDRTIFGELVKYDKIWRTGANKATKITFSRDVTINDKEVPKGSYSFFTIPGKKSWTIILNKETELWGSGDYKEEDDQIRFSAMPVKIPIRERMSFQVLDFDNEKATIAIEWEKTRVAFIVNVDTKDQAMASIEKTLQPSARTFARAARYAWEQNGDLATAEAWASQSIDVKATWYNHWVMASIMAAKGNWKDAYTFMEKAQVMGNQNPDGFFYKDRVEKSLADWKGKI